MTWIIEETPIAQLHAACLSKDCFVQLVTQVTSVILPVMLEKHPEFQEYLFYVERMAVIEVIKAVYKITVALRSLPQ
jgi:hypothetical protein